VPRLSSKGAIMARLVKRFRSKPYAVTFGGETQYICGCGLSSKLPFCDSTHKKVGFRSEVTAFALEPPDEKKLAQSP